MNINTNQIVPIPEANENFSRIALMAEQNGVIISKNNKPKYRLIDIENDTSIEMTDNEKIDFVAAHTLDMHSYQTIH